ncbi:MAG: hypothetical protein ACPLRW_08785 [Moorellales bacterium]
MKKMAFMAPPAAAAAVAGGLSWFLGGAIPDAVSMYGGAAAAGALVGILAALPLSRAAEATAAAAKAKELRPEGAARMQAVVQGTPRAAREDVRELRDLVASLGRLLKTAEEAEAARSAELERASREARRELSEAERLLEAAGRALSGAAQILAAAEEGGSGGQDRGD